MSGATSDSSSEKRRNIRFLLQSTSYPFNASASKTATIGLEFNDGELHPVVDITGVQKGAITRVTLDRNAWLMVSYRFPEMLEYTARVFVNKHRPRRVNEGDYSIVYTTAYDARSVQISKTLYDREETSPHALDRTADEKSADTIKDAGISEKIDAAITLLSLNKEQLPALSSASPSSSSDIVNTEDGEKMSSPTSHNSEAAENKPDDSGAVATALEPISDIKRKSSCSDDNVTTDGHTAKKRAVLFEGVDECGPTGIASQQFKTVETDEPLTPVRKRRLSITLTEEEEREIDARLAAYKKPVKVSVTLQNTSILGLKRASSAIDQRFASLSKTMRDYTRMLVWLAAFYYQELVILEKDIRDTIIADVESFERFYDLHRVRSELTVAARMFNKSENADAMENITSTFLEELRFYGLDYVLSHVRAKFRASAIYKS
uniref:Uncharacterized protein n=1 Tax=Trichogramma kaykai TaxID=54128 RepID=A0ABD2VUE0_9HYME